MKHFSDQYITCQNHDDTHTHTDKYTHLQAHKHACTHLQTYTITDTRLHIQTHTPTHTHRHVRMSGYQTHPCKRARLQTLHLPVRQKILSCYPDLRPLVGCLTHGSIPLSPCASLHNKRLWICRNLLSNTIAGPCLIQHPSFGFCSTQIRACLPTNSSWLSPWQHCLVITSYFFEGGV